MYYNELCGESVSALGFGAMRLPVLDGNDATVDVELATQMIDYALEHGVNYFDSGWDYHGGTSATVTGAALAKHPRDSYFVADKFPGYNRDNFGNAAQIFEQQLERWGVDCFDFYLLHNVCELNIERYLDEERYGTIAYLLQQKEAGRIKHLGFSTHGTFKTIDRFLSKFGSHMEFAQIQLNWFDWSFQRADEKLQLLRGYVLPVVVMEPVRGGMLCNLSAENAAVLSEVHPDWTPAQWSLRFLQGLPQVATTLTGSTSMQQLVQNIATYEQPQPLSGDDRDVLLQLGYTMSSASFVPCTSCRYCTGHCPQNLDIPRLIDLYNEHKSTGNAGFIAPMALGGMPEDKLPAACIGCKRCEVVCPQQIEISEIMRDMKENIPVW